MSVWWSSSRMREKEVKRNSPSPNSTRISDSCSEFVLNIKQMKNFTNIEFYLRVVNCPIPTPSEAHTSYSWLSILYLCCLLCVIGGRFLQHTGLMTGRFISFAAVQVKNWLLIQCYLGVAQWQVTPFWSSATKRDAVECDRKGKNL